MSFSLTSISSESYQQLLESNQRGILVLDDDGRLVFINALLEDMLGRSNVELVGECPLQLFGVPQDDHPWDHHRDIEFVNREGYVRYLRLRPVGETPGGGHSSKWRFVAVMDVTDEERAVRHNLALSQVAKSLAFSQNPSQTLDQVAANVLKATRAGGCSILLLEGRQVSSVNQAGLPESYSSAVKELVKQDEFLVTALDAYRECRPMAARNLRRIALSRNHSAEIHEYLTAATWETVYSAPLMFQGKAQGTLNCYYENEREPEEDVLSFLQAVADQVAILVENARLIEALKGQAVIEERNRIARELHDSVSQALYGIGLGAKTALAHVANGATDSATDSLQYVVSLAKAGLCEMRSLIFELRPESLQTEGLVPAILRQVNSLEVRHGIKVETNLFEPPVDVEVKHSLYRVIQEAFGNITRHAQAQNVELGMRVEGSNLLVRVHDDGHGFKTDQEYPGHYGLKTMSERVGQHGGVLEVMSSGQGTTIQLQIPTGLSNT